ncbi:hypothetical protein [Candidatus Berkiella aquae]|uniref:Uncharacterized protein n=1 Tax=Candidatus Berkiella aquae TaxID=295108 RepID=A0AAE3HWS7_9GAMM|nr:hypothetical protein [Candidatus Berkiella aquae]MCS5711505.1 hypothetical protein [Candidatus Berkiella aquae]
MQIPLKFTGNLYHLRQREATGKLKRPAVTFATEKVDYQALDKDEKLQNYAFSDPVAAELSQYQKMLVLKRTTR